MSDAGERVLVLMPTAKDAERTVGVLAAAGVPAVPLPDLAAVCVELGRAAAVLLTQEAVLADRGGRLAAALRAQPAWSAVPLVVIAPDADDGRLEALADLTPHITLVERPVRARTLVSVVKAALRTRRHQYAARDAIADRDRQKRLYEAVLTTTPDLAYVFDRDHRFIYANQALLTMWGKSWDEAAGKTCLELGYEPWHAAKHDREIEEVVATRRPVRGEVPFTGTHGRRVYDYLFAPVVAAGGEVVAVAGTTRDVTDLKRSADDLRASEERFRAFVTTTSDVVYRMSGDWAVMYPIDGRGLVASTAHPLRDWRRNLPAAEHPRVDAAVAAATATRSTFELEHQVIRPDGSLGWTFSRAVPIPDADGGVAEWFGSATDITARKRAEDEVGRLAAEADRRRRLFDSALSNTADLIYTFDLDGRFTYANPALLALLGRGAAEVVGRNFFDLGYPPDLAARLQRQIRQVIGTRRPVRDDTPYTGTAGEREYEYILAPVAGADGAVEAVVGSTRDITDRKAGEREIARLNAALSARVSELQALFDAAPVGINVASDPDCRVIRGNRALAEMVGMTPDSNVSKSRPDADALPYRILRDGREVPADELPMQKATRTGEAVQGETFEFVRADGTQVAALINAVPVRDAAGTVTGAVGVCADVTPLRRAEAAVRASEQRFRLLDAVGEATRPLTDPAAVLAATTRLLGEHLGVTRCAYADVEADNDAFTIRDDWRLPGVPTTAGRYSLDLFGPRAAADMRAGRTLVVRDADTELPPAGGGDTFRAIGVRAIVCCPLVKGGALTAMMAVHSAAPRDWAADEISLVREVAERSWAHVERVGVLAALREADRRKDEFLATLAHELRNPLAPVRTGLRLLRDAGTDGPAAARTVDMMTRQLAHLTLLVDDLLDVSRIAGGKLALRRRAVDLGAAVRHAVEAAGPLVDGHAHALSVSLPDDPITLDADFTRLAQVVGNLLTNSAKYTPGGGRIALTAAREGGHAVVSVADTGIGIPPAALPRVFDLFHQVDRELEKTTGGLGIGLSLVRGLVAMHGGEVTAESEGEGRGSTFTVRLPCLPVGTRPDPDPDDAPPPASAGRRRVLVVDDNADAADSLAMLLELGGHEVRTANDGLAAVATAETFRPDLILMDVGMPKLNGLDATRRIRAADWGKGVRIVALTGWGQDADRERTAAAGCDDHLVKPVSPDAVARLLA